MVLVCSYERIKKNDAAFDWNPGGSTRRICRLSPKGVNKVDVAKETINNLTGCILVASPLLRDPNFRKTILFICSHAADEGAIAFILNRPGGSKMPVPGCGRVDIYHGGPVMPESLVVASLQWKLPGNVVAFRSFENPDESVLEVAEEWQDGLRVFAGYAGWTAGQLEEELTTNSWLVLPPTREIVEMKDPAGAWDAIMAKSPPLMRLLAAAPDDPSRN